MNPNDRPYSSYGRQPYNNNSNYPPRYNDSQRYNEAPRPPVAEDTLHTQEISIDRKDFRLTLKENVRGRFLRIIEHNGDRHESILIPATGLADFYAVFAQMVEADAEFPVANPTEPEHYPSEPPHA